MNLFITCARSLEPETENEIRKIINESGDQKPEIYKSNMRGILFVNTNIEASKIIDCVKVKIKDEPWSVRYCLRIIPIQLECDTDIEKIKQNILKLKKTVQKDDSYRITIEKRNSDISSQETITEIASLFSNKVSLDMPDWVVLIEIFGNKTGISILKNGGMFSLEKSKRESE